MGLGPLTKMAMWHEGLSHDNGGPNTLYVHPVSGNALGPALYAKDNDLDVKIHLVDIMQGGQMAPWFLALNPQHTIPTLCTKEGAGMWQTGAILRNFAKQVGYEPTDMDNVAMEWRQAEFYKWASGIYGPSLGFGPGDLAEGCTTFKEKAEPMLLFFLKDKKFMGGETPSIADYMFVPVLTMFEASPYAEAQDARIKQYVADFIAASKSWEQVAGMQTYYVGTKKA